MAIYSSYATLAQLATYLGVDVGDLDSDSQRLLNRASEFMQQITQNVYDSTNTSHVEAMQYATCAQVEFWQNGAGEDLVYSGGYKKIAIGHFSAEFNKTASNDKYSQLAQRARMFLNQQGLLYRGVKGHASSKVSLDSDLSN